MIAHSTWRQPLGKNSSSRSEETATASRRRAHLRPERPHGLKWVLICYFLRPWSEEGPFRMKSGFSGSLRTKAGSASGRCCRFIGIFRLLDSFENHRISFVYNSNLSRDWSRKLTIFVNKLNFGKRRAQSLLQVHFGTRYTFALCR